MNTRRKQQCEVLEHASLTLHDEILLSMHQGLVTMTKYTVTTTGSLNFSTNIPFTLSRYEFRIVSPFVFDLGEAAGTGH